MCQPISGGILSGAAPEDPLAEAPKAFNLLGRPLYGGYPQARQLLNSGGGSGKEKPAAA